MARTSDKIKVNLNHNTEPINFENSRKIILGGDGPVDAHIFAYSNNSADNYDYPPDDPYFSEDNEEEPEHEPKVKSLKRNSQKRIEHIPIRCLGSQIEITIQDEDIIRFLKENDAKIYEHNKHSDEKLYSILKTISRVCGVHEKTLKRIAQDGPQRKKGKKFMTFI